MDIILPLIVYMSILPTLAVHGECCMLASCRAVRWAHLVKLARKGVVAHSWAAVGVASNSYILSAVLACERYVMRCQLRQSSSQ